MSSTFFKNRYHRIWVYGKVVEKNLKFFEKEGKQHSFLQLVISCEFYDYVLGKINTQLHVTNVWKQSLLAICEIIEIGDTVEVESYVETERNRRYPELFYHKMNATKIIKIEQ